MRLILLAFPNCPGLALSLAILVACLHPAAAFANDLNLDTSADQAFSMTATLQELARKANPEENFFLNEERARRLEARLHQAPTMQQKIALGFDLGREWLYAGQTEQAIGLLQEMRQILAQQSHLASPRLQFRVGKLLAIANLRLAEQENCVGHHHARSCLFPISQDGRHHLPRGSQNAMRELRALLSARPALGDRWLLNLAAMTLGQHPDAVPEPWRLDIDYPDAGPLQRFEDLAPHLGVDAVGLSGGSIMEDFNGDGHLDLLASSWGFGDPLHYWRNNGDGTFLEMDLETSGLAGLGGGLNLTHADYNNDGYPDVMVLRGAWLGREGKHPNSLLRNRGDGTFEDVTHEAGLLSFHPTQTAAWADFDLDGWLDVFVGTESGRTERSVCELYRNNGDGTFTNIAAEAGLEVIGYVKGAAWGDIDNDGRPDLYVSRFAEPNLLFRNAGPSAGRPWSFIDVTASAGVAEPRQSFATWFWDYDNDGNDDLLVAPFAGLDANSLENVVRDLQGKENSGERPRLYRNRGDGTFDDVTAAMRLDKVLVAMGANFGDLDNDGFLDAYFGTGEPSLETLIPNRMFRNNAGRTFTDVTGTGGFGHLQKGHGISFGDVDSDGDQDIYAVLGGAYSGDVYANALFVNPGTSNRSITLRFAGQTSNRLAQGARVHVIVRDANGRRSIHRTVGTGGSFGSSSLQLEIGLGAATTLERVEVRWPSRSGDVETFTDLEPGRVYLLREGSGKAAWLRPQPS